MLSFKCCEISLRSWRTLLTSVAATVLLLSCAKNPVTGANQLILMPQSWDLQVGQQQYAPLRQSQGGDYTADPSIEAYVRSVGERLAKVSDQKLPYEFNVINNSVPNAWALPGGKISINRGLLMEMGSEAELAAVLGHEIVHAAARHGARGQTTGVLAQTAAIGLTVAGQREGYGEAAQVAAMLGAQLVTTRYGRGLELESDLYGMQYMARAGYDPQGAVDLQKTFVKLAGDKRQDFLSGLFSSHPPSQDRVKANIATAARLPDGGEVGKQRYAQAIARLNKTAPAYEAFDKAQLAMKNGNLDQANTLLRRAIKIEPREAHFRSLLGDVAASKRDWNAARKHYDQAINLNDNYFAYYLKRGEVFKAVGNTRLAEADFARSNRFLPTSNAQLALGDISAARGDKATARQFYAQAAQGRGEIAQRARSQLQSLGTDSTDVTRNPNKDLAAEAGITKKGTLAVRIINRTNRPLGDILLKLRSKGGSSARDVPVAGTLAPGKSRVVDIGIKARQSQLKDLSITVARAIVVGS